MQVSFTPANFSVGQTDESLLGCFRDYLTLVRFPEFKIDEPMQQVCNTVVIKKLVNKKNSRTFRNQLFSNKNLHKGNQMTN